MSDKIGLAITTFNRPQFFLRALDSLKASNIDELVIINDGEPFPGSIRYGVTTIQHAQNLGVGVSKNDGIRYLLSRGCQHIFVMEDDMEILNQSILDIYVEAARVTGLGHFNYGPGLGFNREQLPGIGMHNQHLLNYESKLLKKLVVRYSPTVSLSFFPNLGGMFAYFSRSCIETVGLMDEKFLNVFEHVEHTYRICKTRYHSPFWWFADIDGSERLIKSQDNSMALSSISKRTGQVDKTWLQRMRVGADYFKSKTGYYPAEVPQTTREDVIKFLGAVKPQGF